VTPLDGIVLTVILAALARGIFIGLVREGFSMAALAAAVLVTRATAGPAGAWLNDWTEGQIGELAAPWIAGALIAFTTAACMGLIGRLMRKGVRMAGLSWADRVGGGALGLAEGGLLAVLVVLGAIWIVGREHPGVAESRSLAAYDVVQAAVRERADELPDMPELPPVALPGKS
jgi:uncharacterized membrane protein required for colicin V production